MIHILATIWSIAEPLIVILTVVTSLYLFFKDPLRRWMFWGYRPTAIIALVDPAKKQLLFVLHRYNHNVWQFPQGGLYTSDVVGTVEDIIKRELNINSNIIELEDVYQLRTIKIKGRRISEKNYIGMFKITRRVRGKGYFACIVHADFDKVVTNIEVGYALKDYKILNMTEVKKFLKNSNFPKQHFDKYEMTLQIINDIETDLKSNKK